MKKPKETIWEAALFFNTHFPRTDDTILMILKGQLLVEEALHDILRVHLPRPDAALSIRGFDNKLKIVRSLLAEQHDATLDAAAKLNSVRNSFAHQLEPLKADALIMDFIRATAKPTSAPQAESWTPEQLRSAIMRVCAFLMALGRPEPANKSLSIKWAMRGVHRM